MNKSTQPIIIDLWPNRDSSSTSQFLPEIEFPNPDVENRRFLRNVSVPTLTVFLPERPVSTGTAMVVCPGGGLHALAIDYEGYEIAQWLCQRGIAAFVLKYRLIPTPKNNDEFQTQFNAALRDPLRLRELTRQHTPTVLADGQRAINIVRQHASEWDINPRNIGMMGFSAGAYVTIVTTLQAESQNRPDFVSSIYGAMWDTLDTSSPLPPLFIALTDDDALTVGPSLQLYSAWHAAKCPVEMHIYAQGGHGFAMRNKNLAAEAWIDRLYDWMQVQGIVKP